MKYLVLLAVLVVAYLLWRNARLAERRDAAPPRSASPAGSPGRNFPEAAKISYLRRHD